MAEDAPACPPPALKHVLLSRVSDSVLSLASKPEAFFGVCLFIVLWLLSGPLFGFSAYWQSIIGTIATIVTLLMVFIIQDSQSRDTATIHLKLDELIRANASAKNELLNLEHLTRDQLDQILARYKALALQSTDSNRQAEEEIDTVLGAVKEEAKETEPTGQSG